MRRPMPAKTLHHMISVARCICESKGTAQLCGNYAADERLCFRYISSKYSPSKYTGTVPLLPESKFSSLLPSYVAIQPGLCWTWFLPPTPGFLAMWLIYLSNYSERS